MTWLLLVVASVASVVAGTGPAPPPDLPFVLPDGLDLELELELNTGLCSHADLFLNLGSCHVFVECFDYLSASERLSMLT